METLESLGNKLKTSTSIKQVVSTMKALAASNIKRYEKAARALFDYTKNVERGIQGIIYQNQGASFEETLNIKGKKAIVFFGSNQGLCGRFNDRVIEFGLDDLREKGTNFEDCVFCSVGDRLAMFLENKGVTIGRHYSIPSSLEAISETVNRLLTSIETLRVEEGVTEVALYYTQHDSTPNGTPKRSELLPIEKQIFEEIENRKWVTKQVPVWRADEKELMKSLIRQFLFSSLYHALTMSITSEQSNRLMTLQNAEKNIEELIDTTKLEYNQRRQNVITSELLDVVSGYQSSKKIKKKKIEE